MFFGATTAFLLQPSASSRTTSSASSPIRPVRSFGYMFVAMGAGAYSVGMFHLFTHAFSRRCCS